ncbi:MAG: class I SAM-dependent methyltransferase [Elusimicrobia bacterium]|nr:class I SAM-dependent methyltransferase [Elusimicrobiota bacterium]
MKSISCPVCSASVSVPYMTAYDINWRTSGDPFTLVKCSSCGAVYLSPAPEGHELPDFYPERYYTRASGGVRVTDDMLRGMEEGFRSRLRTLSALGPPGALLDIGCGDGHFIAFMRRHGWDVWGVEMSAAACDYAVTALRLPGERVIRGDILKAALPAGRFDLITLYDVLEHLPNPGAVLEVCRRLLKPGGKIFVQVPNIDSLGRRVFGPFWIHIDVPRHITHFDVKTLRRLFAGWDEVLISTKTDIGIPYIPGYSDSFRRWLRSVRPSPGMAARPGAADDRPSLLRRAARALERRLSKLIGFCADMAGAGEMVQFYARKRK